MNKSPHPVVILQLRAVWANSDAEKQTALICKFLEQLNRGVEREWLDFLLNEFTIGDVPE